MEKTKWYESEPNNTSCLRIGFMIAMICGASGILFCIIFSIMLFTTERWEGISIITTIATFSFGIMAVGDVVKNMQKKHEVTKKVSQINGK